MTEHFRRSKPDYVPEPTCDNFESFEEVFRVSDTDSDEDCYEIKLPKIETVFCGSEAKKLNSANSGVSIEISDDEEGDVEIVLSEGNAQISEKISEKWITEKNWIISVSWCNGNGSNSQYH